MFIIGMLFGSGLTFLILPYLTRYIEREVGKSFKREIDKLNE